LLRELAHLASEIVFALPFVERFAREEVDAQRAEVLSAARLRRVGIDLRAPGDLKVDKAGGHDRGLKLRILQSPGNSASPEINLALRARWHRLLHEDVADLQSPARLERAVHFAKRRRFI